MALAPGSSLGPYRILSALGAGGMGEVYRAHDTRLDREVAVKILPLSLAADPDRLRRFEVEARAASQINDPHILTVHDFGVSDGVPYLVAELLEGQTLRQRLSPGARTATAPASASASVSAAPLPATAPPGVALPVRKAVEIAAKISSGLAAAHAKDVIHRDLKPENIFLTRDGQVKILDFGLAKIAVSAPAASAVATLANEGTQAGQVLGTVGYMSPEQVRGLPADARSDLFALGAILYEMLSGHRAFQRSSSIETMSAILKEEPEALSAANSEIEPGLQRLVDRCLEKDPVTRFQSARDLEFALTNLESASSTARAVALPATAQRPRFAVRWALTAGTGVAIAMIAAVVTWVVAARHASGAAPPAFTQLTFRQGTLTNARFEPDGAGIVYSAAWDGGPVQIYERRAGDLQSRPLGITGSLADISAQGRLAVIENCRIPYFTVCIGTLATATLSGGLGRTLASGMAFATWAPSGEHLAAVRVIGGRQYQLEYPVGHVLWRTSGWIGFPRFSPDGRSIAFIAYPVFLNDFGNVDRIPATGGNPQVLARGFSSLEGLAWSPDGRHIEVVGSRGSDLANTIYSISVAGAERALYRAPAALQLQDVAGNRMLLARANWSVHIRGRFPGGTLERDLTWQDWSIPYALSADGRELVFCECGVGGGPHYSAYIRPTDGGPALRLGDGTPISLSPDGRYVAAWVPSQPAKTLLLPTGPGDPIPLPPGHSADGAFWLPNGQALILAGDTGVQDGMYLYRQDLRNDLLTGAPRAISGLVRDDGNLVASPDSKYVLAQSASDGKWNLYPTTGGTPRPLSVIQPGDIPLQWSADGRLLVGNAAAAIITAIDLASGRRTVLEKIAPPNLTGVIGRLHVVLTPDGRYYAYGIERALSVLVEARSLH